MHTLLDNREALYESLISEKEREIAEYVINSIKGMTYSEALEVLEHIKQRVDKEAIIA